MSEWKTLENAKNPICPVISALTVKQANKYVECVKEKCMWWNKCKEGADLAEWKKVSRMTRLIDAEILFEKVGNIKPKNKSEYELLGKFMNMITNSTTVEIQQWIPCSERLPEDIKPVIVTWKNNDPKSYYQYIVGKHFIGTAYYLNGKWFWYSSTMEDLLAEYGRCDGEEFDEAIEVVAWMPLPEPYKKEGEQK